MIRCPECGIEYSYSRNLCHSCENITIFNGSIFSEQRKEYAWNCINTDTKATRLSCKQVPNFLKSELREINPHPWNSNDPLHYGVFHLIEKKYNLLFE